MNEQELYDVANDLMTHTMASILAMPITQPQMAAVLAIHAGLIKAASEFIVVDESEAIKMGLDNYYTEHKERAYETTMAMKDKLMEVIHGPTDLS